MLLIYILNTMTKFCHPFTYLWLTYFLFIYFFFKFLFTSYLINLFFSIFCLFFFFLRPEYSSTKIATHLRIFGLTIPFNDKMTKEDVHTIRWSPSAKTPPIDHQFIIAFRQPCRSVICHPKSLIVKLNWLIIFKYLEFYT